METSRALNKPSPVEHCPNLVNKTTSGLHLAHEIIESQVLHNKACLVTKVSTTYETAKHKCKYSSPQFRKIIEWNHIQSIGCYLNAFTAVTQLPTLVGMRLRQTQSAKPCMQKIKRNQSEQSIFL